MMRERSGCSTECCARFGAAFVGAWEAPDLRVGMRSSVLDMHEKRADRRYLSLHQPNARTLREFAGLTLSRQSVADKAPGAQCGGAGGAAPRVEYGDRRRGRPGQQPLATAARGG